MDASTDLINSSPTNSPLQLELSGFLEEIPET